MTGNPENHPSPRGRNGRFAFGNRKKKKERERKQRRLVTARVFIRREHGAGARGGGGVLFPGARLSMTRGTMTEFPAHDSTSIIGMSERKLGLRVFSRRGGFPSGIAPLMAAGGEEKRRLTIFRSAVIHRRVSVP